MDTKTFENQFMFAVLYTSVGVFGILGNVLTLITFWKERRNSLFHIQLAIANIITLTSTFMSAPSALKGRWLFGDTLCQWYGFQVFVGGFLGVALTCIVCMETYLAIFNNNSNKGQPSSNTVSVFVSIIVWVNALILSLAPLLGWNAYKRDEPGTSCGASLDNQPSNSLSYMLITHIYFISLATIGFVCLILTMLRKPGDSKVYEPLLTDTELVRVTFLLFTILAIGCLPYYLRVIYFLRGFPPFYDSFLGVEFSHITIKLSSLLQAAAYMFVSENFRRVALSVITGVDPVKKNA
ncbi:visual pigment-like receptor peropsin isoform X2 [Ruditapes philippinarum]|uniref:visual pigment-like receptor peropsin isoform X2 n=1 Tax=Ruditapes philippinarum TaxID=129788 RepID=UPI00295AB2FE|nr:visual pigment-like receptor peropsin isoform X2 [Ruditapes philippinarum]